MTGIPAYITGMTSFDSAKHPRGHVSNKGSFSEKSNSTPEIALRSPRDPSSNMFATEWDVDRFFRPLRSTLPLMSDDNTEFFDSLDDTVLNIANAGRERTRYRRTGGQWQNEETGETLTAADAWDSLFDDEGNMVSAELWMPPGIMYSNATGLTRSDDKPLSVASLKKFLSDVGSVQAVSLTGYNADGEVTASAPIDAGGQSFPVVFTDYGSIRFDAPENKRVFDLQAAKVFKRGLNIVVRHTNTDGIYYEAAYHPVR